MKFIHIEVTARLKALVAVESSDDLAPASLLAALPLSNPTLFQTASVDPQTLQVTSSDTRAFSAGIHEFKVVFFQEFGVPAADMPERVEVIARSRAEAFSLMKSAEAQTFFSKVEVQNLQGGTEARMVQERAGFAVVNSATGVPLVTRLELAAARSRFAQELVKPRQAGLKLVDMRAGLQTVLAEAN